MNTTTKTFAALLTAGLLMGAGSPALALPIEFLDVTFGSDANGVDNGFAGFTEGGNGTWSEGTESINFKRSATNNGSAYVMTNALTGVNALSTDAGNSYTFTSVIQYNSIEERLDRARVGMVVFGDSNGDNGIFLQLYNTSLWGIGTNIGDQPSNPWGGATFGTGAIYTLETTVTFTENDADVSIKLTDNQVVPVTDTLTGTVAKTSLVGDYHGLATRNQGLDFDIQSFNITQTAIPEPSTLALLGVALGWIFCMRRRR